MSLLQKSYLLMMTRMMYIYILYWPVSWWSDSGLGWMLWWLTAEKLWNIISLKLAKDLWLKVWKGHWCPRHRKEICFPFRWFLLIWTKSLSCNLPKWRALRPPIVVPSETPGSIKLIGKYSNIQNVQKLLYLKIIARSVCSLLTWQ